MQSFDTVYFKYGVFGPCLEVLKKKESPSEFVSSLQHVALYLCERCIVRPLPGTTNSPLPSGNKLLYTVPRYFSRRTSPTLR